METLVYLVDSSVFLEALLKQEKTNEVTKFINLTSFDALFITDLSLHSIAIILFRHNKAEGFISFSNELIVGGITILSLTPSHFSEVKQASEAFKLDFEDAYQYVIAKKHNLQIVSFDKDFNRTDIKKKEPSELIVVKKNEDD